MKKLFLVISLVIFAALTPAAVSAELANPCQPMYGNGCQQITKISLVKRVARPHTSDYVNNLGVNDEKFRPNDDISFKLTVTNTSTTVINDIVVKDSFPNTYLTYVSSDGKIDGNNITISISTLAAGESKDVYVKGKVVTSDKLPNDKGIVCDTNNATATAGDQSSSSSSTFCIEKSVLGVVYPAPSAKSTPSTGAEAVSLLGLIPAALTGFALRRKAK